MMMMMMMMTRELDLQIVHWQQKHKTLVGQIAMCRVQIDTYIDRR
jgi:hypothetical protein